MLYIRNLLPLPKADPEGGHRGHVPPLASLNIYSILNNCVIFTTLVHLREALSYYMYRPTSKTVIQKPVGLYHCILSSL